MPHFRVDDMFHGHPKAREAGLAAIGLWTLAGSHSMAYKLDGAVPQYFIDGFKREGDRAAESLARVGLWLPSVNGYDFHDWLDWQPSAEEIEKDRERQRLRSREFRRRLREGKKGSDDK